MVNHVCCSSHLFSHRGEDAVLDVKFVADYVGFRLWLDFPSMRSAFT